MICAIHQPNFFPWLGYFDKIRRADVFVFLDDVDYPKSGNSMGSWCNRVRVNVQGRPAWVRCPVVREHGPQRIRDVRIDADRPWRAKFVKTLEANYRRSPFYRAAMAVLEPLVEHDTPWLAEFNMRAVTALAGVLGIGTRFVTQSAIPTDSTATMRLIEICRAVGADTYLCGGGADGYQDDALFAEHGVTLRYQDFHPEPYGDPARFLPGLSVIDYLMNAGAPARDRRS